MKKTAVFLLFCSLFLPAFSQTEEKISILQEFNLYFSSGKSTITSSSAKVLDSVLLKMNEKIGLKAYLVAYTDSVGTEIYNVKLSKKRVEAMSNYLISKNIPKERILANYKGELYESQNNLALNRKGRVVLLEMEHSEIIEPPHPPEQVLQEEPPKTEMMHLKGRVLDMKTKKPLEKVMIEIASAKDKKQLFTDKDGFYELEMEKGKFSISANLNCYFFTYTEVENGEVTQEMNILLEKMKKGAKLPLQDIVFVGDAPEILPESEPELQRLLYLMKENPKLKVEIGGHINAAATIPFKYQFYVDGDSLLKRGNLDYATRLHSFDMNEVEEARFFLSLDRARSVRNFLMQKGIENQRISYKGYSGTQMKYPYPRTPDQEKMNRRVEITVTESECE